MALDLESALNREQREAAMALEGPLLIIAGAGSGKTRTITCRIGYMLEQGVPQYKVLGLTFTNKAAREMGHRIRELTGKKLKSLTLSTFHSFGVSILRKTIDRLGFKPNFSIYDQSDKMALIKEVASEMGYAKDSLDLYGISNLFSAIKTSRIGWNRGNDQHRELYKEYQSHLHAYNSVDFDDLIVLPSVLFRDHPEVLEEYRERFEYIMVDEFQDTSLSQYELVRALAEKHRNLCVVGDDDQSIYSWRGANYENLINFERDFPERTEIKLEQNYRSTKNILQAANTLIANNKDRKEKTLWTGIEGGKAIALYFPENEMREAEFISESIKTLKLREGYPYHSFGVLVRANSLTRTIEEAFLAENIPYRVSGGTSFFQRKEVKDIISYLRVIVNPDDDVNMLRIINTPRRGIGKKGLMTIREVAENRGFSIYSAMSAIRFAEDSPLPEKTKQSVDDFLSLLEHYRETLLFGKPKSLSKTLKGFVDALDYWGWLVLEYQSNERVARFKYGNITNFLQIIENWENDPDIIDTSLYAFLNRITLVTREEAEEEEGKVNLMTIHAAKGLEFDIVFIPAVEENIIPHSRSLEEDGRNLEEERRLFYVALTRAKQKLFLTSCLRRKVMRDYVETSPSPFIEEIPQELIEIHEEEIVEKDEAEDIFNQLKAKFGQVP